MTPAFLPVIYPRGTCIVARRREAE